ncbi:MAG: branched-chain amino acid ABC transporter permease [Candidatus Kariarchaeaceae archaeon]|jgi:branched-subunit amino acid ABC-type transport system permease component
MVDKQVYMVKLDRIITRIKSDKYFFAPVVFLLVFIISYRWIEPVTDRGFRGLKIYYQWYSELLISFLFWGLFAVSLITFIQKYLKFIDAKLTKWVFQDNRKKIAIIVSSMVFLFLLALTKDYLVDIRTNDWDPTKDKNFYEYWILYWFVNTTIWIILIISTLNLVAERINPYSKFQLNLSNQSLSGSVLSINTQLIQIGSVLSLITINRDTWVLSKLFHDSSIVNFPVTIEDTYYLIPIINFDWILFTFVWLMVFLAGIFLYERYQENSNQNVKSQKSRMLVEDPNDSVGLNPLYKSFLSLIVFMLVLQFLIIRDGESGSTVFDIGSTIFETLRWGSIFISLAIGLNLTYKILGFPNFAHAEYLTIGGFVAIFMQTIPIFSQDPSDPGKWSENVFIASLIAAFIVSGLLAILFDHLIFRRMRNKNATPQAMMIASLGLALLLRGLLFLRFTGVFQYFEPPEATDEKIHRFTRIRFRFNYGEEIGQSFFMSPFNTRGDIQLLAISSYEILMILIINGLVILILLFMKYTKLGKAMRALSDDPELAASSGINVDQIRNLSWFLGGGLAGTAGALWAGAFRFFPETGSQLLLAAFAVIVLGSIGSFEGAIVAAFIVGFFRSISLPILVGVSNPLDRSAASSYITIVPYVILLIVLVFMPKGIGHEIEQKRLEKARKTELENIEEEEL